MNSINESMSPLLIPTPLTSRTSYITSTMTPGWGTPSFGTPSWGGEDARLLQDYLAARVPMSEAPLSAVTPGVGRQASTSASPWIPPPSSSRKGCTPRVVFKEELTQTINFDSQRTDDSTVSIFVCSNSLSKTCLSNVCFHPSLFSRRIVQSRNQKTLLHPVTVLFLEPCRKKQLVWSLDLDVKGAA
jgi:hypothetical protein